jgi:hypothetical protein
MRQAPVGYHSFEICRQTSSRKEENVTHTTSPFTGTNVFVIPIGVFRSEDCGMILTQPTSRTVVPTTVVPTTPWLTTSLKRNNADLTTFATKLS